MSRGKQKVYHLSAKEMIKTSVSDNVLYENGHIAPRKNGQTLFSYEQPIRGTCREETASGSLLYAVVGSDLHRISFDADMTAHDDNLGSLTGAAFGGPNDRAAIFPYNGKIYVLGGGSYYVLSGNTITAVSGYVPTIRRHAAPNGFGDAFEAQNMLTNQVRMRFIPDGTSQFYQLFGRTLSVDSVKVNGQTVTGWDSAISAGTAIVHFNTAPAASPDDILEVTYTLYGNNRSRLTACKKAFSFDNGTDLHPLVYGDGQGHFFAAGVSDRENGHTPDAEYFPVSYETTVGDGIVPLNGMVRQGVKLVLFTAAGAYTATYRYDPDSFETPFSLSLLHAGIGTDRYADTVLLDNDPYVCSGESLYRFTSTSKADESAAIRIELPQNFPISDDFFKFCKLFADRAHSSLWCYSTDGILIYSLEDQNWVSVPEPCPTEVFEIEGEIFYTTYTQIGWFHSVSIDQDALPGFDTAPVMLSDNGKAKTLYRVGIVAERVSGTKISLTLKDDNGASKEMIFTVTSTLAGAADTPILFEGLVHFEHLHWVKASVAFKAASVKSGIREIIFSYR